ncbi:MAG: hypothetical protein IPN01_19075 [Deltaproteobacteria bacterium]|nr:hypothetical protein [Deltaproteobacteria bacterium]
MVEHPKRHDARPDRPEQRALHDRRQRPVGQDQRLAEPVTLGESPRGVDLVSVGDHRVGAPTPGGEGEAQERGDERGDGRFVS